MRTAKMMATRPRPGLAANHNDVTDSTSAANDFDILARHAAEAVTE